MSFELTAQELALYTNTGFFVRHGVFAQREIEAFRLGADAALATARAMTATPTARRYSLDGNRFVDVGHVTVQFEHSLDAQKIRVIEPVHHLHEVFEALVDDERLVQPMCQLIGEDKVSLWTAKFNAKSAEIGSGFGWHQDSPYWVHDSEDVARLPNVMLNFDDSSIANGCLHLIGGSHKAGMLPGCSDGRQLAGFLYRPRFR
jgi:ectoine hydroxylase-related dioxygenase (phytanoyl-CoA dioxygenase family)